MSQACARRSPARECSSMFLTIESARLPCCTTLSRLPCSSSINSADLARLRRRARAVPSASLSSSMSSIESAAKLLTKLSGFLISCAMPAVSWPSEASFSVWISRSCAALSSSSDFASSRVRASTSSNRRAFWIASTDWAAKVWSRSIVELREQRPAPCGAPQARRRRGLGRSSGTTSNARYPAAGRSRWIGDGGSVVQVRQSARAAALAPLRRCTVRPGRRLCLPDRGDQSLAHAVGRAQAKLLAQLAEDVDRAGLGAGELHRLGDDRVEHGLADRASSSRPG